MGVLRPIDMKVQPAPYDARMKVLHKVVELLKKYKVRTPNTDKLVVQWENEVAKRSNSKQGYLFNSSVLLRDISKHKGELNSKGRPEPPKRTINKDEIFQKLSGLLLDAKTLKVHGYILGPDSDLQSTDQTDNKLRACERCYTKFNEEEIMTPTKCQFHTGRKQFNRETKLTQYTCCGENETSVTPFSLGCKSLEHHVYRRSTFEDMSKTIEFKYTKEIAGFDNVLALDCEMAYTSSGYEMVRLTIVDFWTNSVLFDEIIQPIGDIIDLNSEFSGVHEIDRAVAMTFEEAQKIFLSPTLINGSSILIGHGLENDLNVLRIIHERVIDTAILYPNGKYKSSLKNLAFQELSRRIQIGEHDSSEDAIATMDVIKHKLGLPIDRKLA